MISVKDLVKEFGSVRAVYGVSFELSAGESLVIYGPSGSGKTTLLRLIAGLEIPDAGIVILNGIRMSGAGELVPPHQRNLGFVFQAPALWPHMTVAQNIQFGLKKLPSHDAKERLKEILKRTGLEGMDQRYPSQLSGGEARRVSLARTLAPKPKILLMDEPLTNLDPDLKTNLLNLVLEIVSKENITMIYVTHDRQEADQIAGDFKLEMRGGKIYRRDHPRDDEE
jgi:ABC-type Fe3+/spermidine/putrescine transport system ATPase subunit